MKERERDQALLSLLAAEDRAVLEEMVENFVGAELPEPTPQALLDAADLFEDAGVARPPVEGITGLWMAALLRERAAGALNR